MLKNIVRDTLLFAFGGFSYGLLEVLWRQRTHVSMVLTGGVCFLTLFKIFRKFPQMSWLKRFLCGSLIISLAELLTGLVVNRLLHLGVWDYSRLPFNFMGQVCLGFSLLWGAIAVGVSLICPFISRHFEVEKKKRQTA